MNAMKWFIAALALMTVLVSSAIEAPKPAAPAKTPAKEAPAPQEPAKDEPATAAGDEAKPAETPAPEPEEEALPPLPPDTVPSGPAPQRFNPTEKVRADFPVSFPIDI